MPSVKSTSTAASKRKPVRAPGMGKTKSNMNVRMKKRSPAKKRRQTKTQSFWTWGKIKAIAILTLVTGIIMAGYWFVSSGKLTRLEDAMVSGTIDLIKGRGFVLEHVIVDGRTRTDKEELLASLDVEKGAFIYDVDLQAKLKAVEDLPWVLSARLERRLPNTLYVKLVERHPIAFFQDRKKHYLVDTKGDVIGSYPLKDYPGFIIATGEGAPKAMPNLIQHVGRHDVIYAKITGAKFVSNRRWDLILNNVLTVKLPEDDIDDALDRLADLEAENRLSSPKIDTIDLRSPGKVYFYMSKEGKAKQAKLGKKIA